MTGFYTPQTGVQHVEEIRKFREELSVIKGV
jgi:hypothetical protein